MQYSSKLRVNLLVQKLPVEHIWNRPLRLLRTHKPLTIRPDWRPSLKKNYNFQFFYPFWTYIFNSTYMMINVYASIHGISKVYSTSLFLLSFWKRMDWKSINFILLQIKREGMFPQGCFVITLQTGKLAAQNKWGSERKTFRRKFSCFSFIFFSMRQS